MPSLFLYHLSLQKIICTKPHSIYQECYEKYFIKSYDIILDCEKFFKPGSISYDWWPYSISPGTRFQKILQRWDIMVIMDGTNKTE